MNPAGTMPMAIKARKPRVRAIARSSAMVIGALLTACTVGPNFKPPQSPAATRYLAASEPAGAPDDAAYKSPRQTIALGQKVTADWWTVFKSPDLDSLVALSIQDSRTLESARARLAQARESVAAASSALYPQVSLNASASREFRIEPECVSLAA
jgi:outer membrane protein TolC